MQAHQNPYGAYGAYGASNTGASGTPASTTDTNSLTYEKLLLQQLQGGGAQMMASGSVGMGQQGAQAQIQASAQTQQYGSAAPASAYSAQSQSYGQAASPYGQPAAPSTNPYAAPQPTAASVYGQTSATASTNPYGQAAPSAATTYAQQYAQLTQQAAPPPSPYGQPAATQPTAASVYGQAATASTDPYGKLLALSFAHLEMWQSLCHAAGLPIAMRHA
jgi:hypothetical protein